MASVPDPGRVIAELDERMRRERHLDLGTSELAGELAGLTPQQGLSQARTALIGRVSDLQAAITDVSATIQQLGDLSRVVRFTEAGWPERRDELTAQLADDPAGGLASWLEDWFTAVCGRRPAAVDRLLGLKDSLPSGAVVLYRRCVATSAALDKGLFDVGAPLLEAGARGIPLAGQVVPDAETRRDAWVLLVRFALSVDRPDDARRILDDAAATGSQPIFAALRERLTWRGSGPAPIDLMSTAAGAPDAALEIARVVSLTAGATRSSDLRFDAGVTVARTAVASTRSLDQVDEQVGRLMSPVPAEIHLALAERALSEDRPDLAAASFRLAANSAVNPAVRAEAHDQLAALAAAAGDAQGRGVELLAAASSWSDAMRSDRAAESAQALIDVDPRNVEARCQLASALVILAWFSPMEAAVPQLRRALEVIGPVAELLETASPAGADPEWLRSWALWNESYSHQALAEFDGEPQADHRWKALDGAVRAVQAQPVNASMWNALHDAASGLKLWALAEIAAGRAVALDATRDAVSRHAGALANLGEFDRCLEVLGEPTNSFESNMRAHVLLRLDRASEAAEAFAVVPPDRTSPWAGVSSIHALVLVGPYTAAVAAAKELDASLRPRRNETSIQIITAALALLSGDYPRVESLQGELTGKGEHGADFALAEVRLIEGRADEAQTLFRSYIRNFTTLDDVACWELVDSHLLAAVLQDKGVVQPDLEDVNREVDEVRAELLLRRDPLVEIESRSGDGADPAFVATAKEGVRAVIALTRLDANEPAGDVSSEGGNAQKASAASGEPAAEPLTLSVVCPPSWFAGFDSPTEQHPLFLRELPELRLTSSVAIAPVNISVDEALEPDGYRIEVAGVPIASGTVPVGRRLLPASALTLVPPATASALTDREGTASTRDGVLVSEDEGDRLIVVLSESALGVLMRRIEEAVIDRPYLIPPDADSDGSE